MEGNNQETLLMRRHCTEMHTHEDVASISEGTENLQNDCDNGNEINCDNREEAMKEVNVTQRQCYGNHNKEEAWNVFDPNVYWEQSHKSEAGERGKMHGIVFARNWIMNMLIYLIEQDRDAELSVENTEYKGFDDLVINAGSHIYCFQFKCLADDTRTLKNEELWFSSVKSPYSAINYFHKFCEGLTNYDVEDRSSSVILFTNRLLDNDIDQNILKSVEEMPSELLDKSLFDNYVYKLHPIIIKHYIPKFKAVFDKVFNTISDRTSVVDFESTLKLFTENFYICAGQKSNYNQLTNEVKDRIGAKYGIQHKHELFNWFFKDFESWYRTADNEDKRNEGVVIPTNHLSKYFVKLQSFYKEK